MPGLWIAFCILNLSLVVMIIGSTTTTASDASDTTPDSADVIHGPRTTTDVMDSDSIDTTDTTTDSKTTSDSDGTDGIDGQLDITDYSSSTIEKLISLSSPHTSPTLSSVQACLLLGNIFSGFVPFSVTSTHAPFSLPPLDLSRAMDYYICATRMPHNRIGEAYYMLSFLMHYFPQLVSNDAYKSKFKEILETSTTTPVTQSQDESTKKEGLNNVDQQQQEPMQDPQNLPNIPLILNYQHFAASLNYTPALISLAYKHFYGYHLQKSCYQSSVYYRKAIENIQDDLAYRPRLTLSTESVHLNVEYNSGQNMMSDEEDIVQFYRYSADFGDTNARVMMGIIYLEGDVGGVKRNLELAFRYFKTASESDDETEIALSLTYLGWCYQHGYGTKLDLHKAVQCYKRAVLLGSPAAMTQLGLIYLHGDEGSGIEKNVDQGKKLLDMAGHQNDPEALLQLGHLTLSSSSFISSTGHVSGSPASASISRARTLYQQSSQGGNLQAMYHLALQNLHTDSCTSITSLFRKILDRSLFKDMCFRAYHLYAKGYYQRSLMHYLLAADQGSMLAQLNAAWLWEMGFGEGATSTSSGTLMEPKGGGTPTGSGVGGGRERERTATGTERGVGGGRRGGDGGEGEGEGRRGGVMMVMTMVGGWLGVDNDRESGRMKALDFYRKAAEQNAAEGNLKLGDYYYFGWAGITPNPSTAALFYKIASDLRNPQATFNLAYMHHFGIGLPRDLHLAKRYYDSATEMHAEAFIPSLLTLWLLHLENAYNYVTSEEFFHSFSLYDMFSSVGYSTDTWLIIALLMLLIIVIVLRQIVIVCLDTV